MEIIKLKKVQMQVVKKMIFLIFVFFCFSICSGQEILGEYRKLDPNLAAMDTGVTYDFRTNGTFEQTTHKHLERKEIFGGNYKILGDTLILQYHQLESNLYSTAKLIKKKKLDSSDLLFAKIQVFNSKGYPQPGVNLMLQTTDKTLVLGFSSNNQGAFPPIAIYDNYIKYLKFTFLGHREISINTDTLFGYQTEIKVQLEDSSVTYHNSEIEAKFLIINHNSEGMELIPLQGNKNEMIKLSKVN